MKNSKIIIKGYELVEWLVVEDIKPVDDNSETLENIASIPVILTIDKIENYVEFITDAYGNNVASFAYVIFKSQG